MLNQSIDSWIWNDGVYITIKIIYERFFSKIIMNNGDLQMRTIHMFKNEYGGIGRNDNIDSNCFQWSFNYSKLF